MTRTIRRLFSIGGAVAACLALTATSAFAVTITPDNTTINGTAPVTTFNAGSSSVSCNTNTAAIPVGPAPNNNVSDLSSLVFDDCSASVPIIGSLPATVTVDPSCSYTLTVNADATTNIHIPSGCISIDVSGLCSIQITDSNVADELIGGPPYTTDRVNGQVNFTTNCPGASSPATFTGDYALDQAVTIS